MKYVNSSSIKIPEHAQGGISKRKTVSKWHLCCSTYDRVVGNFMKKMTNLLHIKQKQDQQTGIRKSNKANKEDIQKSKMISLALRWLKEGSRWTKTSNWKKLQIRSKTEIVGVALKMAMCEFIPKKIYREHTGQ